MKSKRRAHVVEEGERRRATCGERQPGGYVERKGPGRLENREPGEQGAPRSPEKDEGGEVSTGVKVLCPKSNGSH